MVKILMKKDRHITQSISIQAPADVVWKEITQLDISAFRHPPYLVALGIPKPLKADITTEGVGGARVAHFSRNRRFTQTITAWEPGHHFAFTFTADPGFRAGHVLDLSDGPFQMVHGAYRLAPAAGGVTLSLSSTYSLRGPAGAALALPVRLVLWLFQRYLLQGIKANAERTDA